jgi:UDP-N-acetylglucosamine diphosphorylase/glucosamine-1-phosphate N-acetyltransferase
VDRFVCVFEDKKFANFFPLALSQPVFELRIGGRSLRGRLQADSGAEKFGVMCREYLAPAMSLREPAIMVNQLPGGETLFLNGRLLCYKNELRELIERVPEGGMAVKGGFVIAARLTNEAAADFARHVQLRLSEESLEKLCDELRNYVSSQSPATTSKRDASSHQPAEGTHEDEHATGQDSVAEKLSQRLLKLIDRHHLARLDVPEARLLSFPWQIIEENTAAIEDDFQKSPFRGQSEESVVYPGVQMVGEENVVVGESAVVRPGVVLDASTGPIIIHDGAMVMPNAVVVGPVYIGKGSVIKSGAKILSGTSVGDTCKIGGEVAQTVFAGYANKQHDGFIGHSYIGEWVNIGAGTNNSDLKNNYSAIRMWSAGMVRQTGRQFLGLVMGDHTKTGIGTLFNSGTVVGFNCNIFGGELVDKFVPSFSWGRGRQLVPYELEKALLTAQVVMERRNVRFDDAYRGIFEKIFELSGKSQRNM